VTEKTYAEIVALLAHAVDAAGGAQIFQAQHNVWNIYEMLNGKRKISDNALEAIGCRKRMIYEQID
jgi:hypothetical protein